MSAIYFDKKDYSPLVHYNSLIDLNLQGYYSKPLVRNHLRKSGLINRRGEIIPEEVWKTRNRNRDRSETASRITANRIVQKAIEIKNLERAEVKRKLEEVAKKEMVSRIRGKSSHGHRLPHLWSSASFNERENRDYALSQRRYSSALLRKIEMQ